MAGNFYFRLRLSTETSRQPISPTREKKQIVDVNSFNSNRLPQAFEFEASNKINSNSLPRSFSTNFWAPGSSNDVGTLETNVCHYVKFNIWCSWRNIYQ